MSEKIKGSNDLGTAECLVAIGVMLVGIAARISWTVGVWRLTAWICVHMDAIQRGGDIPIDGNFLWLNFTMMLGGDSIGDLCRAMCRRYRWSK